MREKFYRFMYGRYGVDQFSKFLSYFAVGLIILQLVANTFSKAVGQILGYLAIVLFFYAYFRIFSKKLEKRRLENAKFLRGKSKLFIHFKNKKERMAQRRDFKFFKCPSCHAMLRVPRGVGKVRVTCSKCGTAFERKT